MKAIELSGLEGFDSLRLVSVEKPRPQASEVLIEVKAAGLNFAEIELTRGRYPAHKPLPSSWALRRQELSSSLARE